MSTNIDRITDFLSVVQRVKWWVLAAFATPFVIETLMEIFSTKPDVALPVLENQLVQMIGIFSFFILVYKSIDNCQTLVREHSKKRITCGIDKLTSQQTQFLLDVFRSGQRSISVGPKIFNERWFEKLTESNYIEFFFSPQALRLHPSNLTFYVTVNGWKRLEKHVGNQLLKRKVVFHSIQHQICRYCEGWLWSDGNQ